MIDSTMRRLKHRVVGGFAHTLGRHVRPMPLTLFALGVGLGAVAAAAAGRMIPALALWLFNRFLDGLDGEVARSRGDSSDLGGYVDMMSDVLIYAAIPLAVVYARQDPALTAAVLLMITSFYANITSWSYLSALLEKRNISGSHETSIIMPKGLMEGTETIVLYGLLLAVPGIARETALIGAAAAVVSTVQRVVWATRFLRP